MPTRFPMNFQETRAMELFVLGVIREELETYSQQHPFDHSGILDAGSSAGFRALRTNSISPTANGINGSRGDDIAVDGGNSDGSFFANDYRIIVHRTKGSAQVYTGQLFIEEANEGVDLYGEGGIYEAQLFMRRRGAYGAIAEGLVTVEPNKQSRAAGQITFVSEANDLASYTMLSDRWNMTGYRNRWTASLGAEAAGVVEFVEGDWEKGYWFELPDLATPILYSKQAGLPVSYELRANGSQFWGAGDAALEYLGGDTMKFTNHLIVDGQFVFEGSIRNADAGNEFAGASAGAGGALPATVEKYLLVYDSAGVGRKIPMYAI